MPIISRDVRARFNFFVFNLRPAALRCCMTFITFVILCKMPISECMIMASASTRTF